MNTKRRCQRTLGCSASRVWLVRQPCPGASPPRVRTESSSRYPSLQKSESPQPAVLVSPCYPLMSHCMQVFSVAMPQPHSLALASCPTLNNSFDIWLLKATLLSLFGVFHTLARPVYPETLIKRDKWHQTLIIYSQVTSLPNSLPVTLTGEINGWVASVLQTTRKRTNTLEHLSLCRYVILCTCLLGLGFIIATSLASLHIQTYILPLFTQKRTVCCVCIEHSTFCNQVNKRQVGKHWCGVQSEVNFWVIGWSRCDLTLLLHP